MVQKKSHRPLEPLDTLKIIFLCITLVVVFAHLYLYFRNLDTMRFIVGRMLYAKSWSNLGFIALYMLQYGLLFFNIQTLAQTPTQDDASTYIGMMSRVISRVGIFLLLNLVGETLILRYG